MMEAVLMKFIQKLIAAAAAFSLGAGMLMPVNAEGEDNKEFDEFMTEEFVETMESDFMNMHFTIRDYAALGIEKPEPVIGSASWSDYEEAIKDCDETLAELEAFDYNSLSETQQHDYDTYHFYLERMKELNSYPDYDWWFMPSEGLIDNLPTNFTEYVFYEKQDIDDYLSVLASVPDYIEGALEITKTQVEHGVFMTDSALDQTLDAIQKFVNRTDDNPLIVIFEENIDAFEGLSESEKADYKARNREILFNSYIPSYNHAAEVLESFRGTRKSDVTTAELPHGKDYYAARIRFKASTEKTPEELLDLCKAYISQEIQNYITLLYSVSDESELEDTVDIEEPEDIIAWHRDHMSVYPKGPEVRYRAAYLDPAVASDGIIAYYLEPPVDFIEDNVIKINGDNVADVNELYSTLGHEGFPGHLYQITWYLNTKPNLIRTAISNIGYTEGWAMYAEDDAWNYSTLNEAAKEMMRIDTSMSYVMNAAADIGVNGLGWDVDQLSRWLENAGFSGSIASDLYDFVMDTPGVIIPYGAGLAQFMTIRDNAMYRLGSQFDMTEFNRILLTYGDRPFELVEKDVEAWIGTFDPSAVTPATPAPIDNPDPVPSKGISPWIYAGGIGIALIAVIAGIILVRKGRRDDPFA